LKNNRELERNAGESPERVNMNKSLRLLGIATAYSFALLLPTGVCAFQYDHEKDVVYGYKDGMALVMDVFAPVVARNAGGVILVMAGGMNSSPIWSHQAADRPDVQSLMGAGYTVFAVAHSSRPKYTVDDIRGDLPRAVRFIRHHAARFGVDPQRLGIMGHSSGAQMSLLTAAAPPPANVDAADPVDRESSRVQAVVAYYPAVDMLNFGQPNTTILQHFRSQGRESAATFDFHIWDPETGRFERVVDPEVRSEFFRRNSPLTHTTSEHPPVLIFHGEADELVPIQQSELLTQRLREVGVPHKLIVAQGRGHGWPPVEAYQAEVLEWFGEHLLGTER
jgi:acetyl esterase/lipase